MREDYLLERIRTLGTKNEVAREVGDLRFLHKGKLKVDYSTHGFVQAEMIPKLEVRAPKDDAPAIPAFDEMDDFMREADDYDHMLNEEDLDYKIKRKEVKQPEIDEAELALMANEGEF